MDLLICSSSASDITVKKKIQNHIKKIKHFVSMATSLHQFHGLWLYSFQEYFNSNTFRLHRPAKANYLS